MLVPFKRQQDTHVAPLEITHAAIVQQRAAFMQRARLTELRTLQTMKFIQLQVRHQYVLHGYDEQNGERLEEVPAEALVEKLISVERILSATEQFVLVTGPFGRQMYWAYAGGLAALTARLARAGLVIE
jgi:hypothetical protein